MTPLKSCIALLLALATAPCWPAEPSDETTKWAKLKELLPSEQLFNCAQHGLKQGALYGALAGAAIGLCAIAKLISETRGTAIENDPYNLGSKTKLATVSFAVLEELAATGVGTFGGALFGNFIMMRMNAASRTQAINTALISLLSTNREELPAAATERINRYITSNETNSELLIGDLLRLAVDH